MHWIHRQRQGWLVVGLGAALMSGCGSPAAGAGRLAEERGAAAAQTAPLEEPAPRPQAVADPMPLLPGDNVPGMPVALPEELAVAMPGAAALAAGR